MAGTREKIIISCALTGSIHTPSMSPHLPITPEQIVEDGVAAAEAGAAILHLHAREPDTGRPIPDPRAFMRFLPSLKQQTAAVLNVTTGGGHNMSVAERLEAALAAEPEMCSLNLGSMNFGIFPMAERRKEWKHSWEPEYLEMTRDFIFRNTFKDIEQILLQLGSERGARFEFECYDTGHLYTLKHFLDRSLVKPPLFIQMVLGILGGTAATPENFMHMKRTADELFGSDYQFSVLGAGRSQMALATISAICGGHLRVGLEDNMNSP